MTAPPDEGGRASLLTALQEAIDYRFENTELLVRALTHPSYAHEHPEVTADNQRLEFLGDAVLGLVVARLLFGRYTDVQEGRLSRMKSALVCEDTLAGVAERVGVGHSLLLGRGEQVNRGHEKASLLADALEALLGAVYLDRGYDVAAHVVQHLFEDLIAEARRGRLVVDFKTAFQEFAQARGSDRPSYAVTNTSGPPHDRTFRVVAKLEGEPIAEGVGRSKKEAEKRAAAAALAKLRAAEEQGG